MSNYRIIEKKGKTVKGRDMYDVYVERYIPRFIVQEGIEIIEKSPWYSENIEIDWEYKDLKEFNNLEEAREYKRDLDLEDGIIIE